MDECVPMHGTHIARSDANWDCSDIRHWIGIDCEYLHLAFKIADEEVSGAVECECGRVYEFARAPAWSANRSQIMTVRIEDADVSGLGVQCEHASRRINHDVGKGPEYFTAWLFSGSDRFQVRRALCAADYGTHLTSVYMR